MMRAEVTYSPSVLLVDDTPTNLRLLSETLRAQGWRTFTANDGESAIEQVHYASPDLILLDIQMPGIDGFEVCRRLKASPKTQAIPIIFMTALSETTDKVEGLALGAVDYITKPVQQEEVIARVKLHLHLSQLAQDLQQKNKLLNLKIAEQAVTEAKLKNLAKELEQRVEERTAKLEESLYQVQRMQQHLVQQEKLARLSRVNDLDYTENLLQIIALYQQHYPQPIPAIAQAIEAVDLALPMTDRPKVLCTQE